MPWRMELLGFVIAILAAMTLLGYLGLTESSLLHPWIQFVRQLAGWGVIPLSLLAAVVGLYIMVRKAELPVQVFPSQVIGLELILISLLPISHMVWGEGLGSALMGKGGGVVGWALSEPLIDVLGPILTGLILALIFSIGLALSVRIGWSDIVDLLTRASLRLQIWSSELEEEVAERRADVEDGHADSGDDSGSALAGATDTSMSAEGLIIIDDSALGASTHELDREEQLPPIELLDEGALIAMSPDEIDTKKQIIEQTLADFGLPATVTEIRRGPAVTQFGVQPGYIERTGPDGEMKQFKVRVGQISALRKDLALALAVTRLRIQAPVPGRGIVGVEVPNAETSVVRLRSVIESENFQQMDSPLTVALGLDVTGSPVAIELGRLPHLLIAGTTGSGKSVCLNAFITCLILNNSPDRLKMIMIDPKKVELIRFNGTPHLIGKVEVEGERVIGVLRWLTTEMDRRYELFAAAGAKHLDDYNRMFSRGQYMGEGNHSRLPYIVLFIDELADLMATYPGDVERTLCRLAQMARATGIHLVVATQRPSTDVITGLIKANFPARASFAVASGTDSRVILDAVGAEHLLGKGDMLFLPPDANAPMRVQGCFVNDREVEDIVSFWQQQIPPESVEPAEPQIAAPWEPMIKKATFVSQRDEMLEDAIALARKNDNISTSLIQRRLRIGYPRAARLMESLYELGLVEDLKEGGRTRKTYVSDQDDPLADLLEEEDPG